MSKMKDTIKDEVRDDYKEHRFHDKPLRSCSSCFKRFSPNDWDAYEAWVEQQWDAYEAWVEQQGDLEELAKDNFYDR